MLLKGRLRIPIHRISMMKEYKVKHPSQDYTRRGSKTYLEVIAKELNGLEITSIYTEVDEKSKQSYYVFEYRGKDEE